MITVYLLLAVLSIVSPEDGAMVPTLTDLQKSYFKRDSTQRFALMENAAERKKFCAEGAVQKPLRLSWTGDTNAVYLLSVDGGEAFTISNRTHAYITNLEIGKRFKWSVRLAGSSQTASAEFVTEDIPPRFIKVDGIVNCRDLGGWRTVDGRRVRENMILIAPATNYIDSAA